MQGEYLAHHGIKGQKWGVRRFQNEDGSLTPAGLKRYDRHYDKYEKFQSRSDKQAAKINNSVTRLGKRFHNGRAAINQRKANMQIDLAENANSLSGRLGARFGAGQNASINDALSDYYERQGQYRKTKIGKHLAGVAQYNSANNAKASEKIHNTSGIINKGKAAVEASWNTPMKSIVGRDTKAGEQTVAIILGSLAKKSTVGKNVKRVYSTARAAADIAYLAKKNRQKKQEGNSK